MQLFECQHCSQLLYFEKTRCEYCGPDLGYLPQSSVLSAVEWENSGCWRPLANRERPSRFCANAVHGACNWLLPAGSPEMFCRLNHSLGQPDLYPFVLAPTVMGKLRFVHPGVAEAGAFR